MYYFRNDYSESALPEILEALTQTDRLSTIGYGRDPHCAQAADAIRSIFSCPDADVHFLVGGTQTNQTALAAFLRPWEAVVAAETGHIAVHETGAIEATGHKVYTIPSPDGKLTPELIYGAYEAHMRGEDEHMVLPKLVYISDSTELGTIYSRAELEALSKLCRSLGIYLYLDGARLAVALDVSDIRPEDMPHLCDAFYIGGTKNGLLFGEALVIVRDELKPHFRHAIKQRGGMLAKGWLLGIQFTRSFENDLWLKAAAHANTMAHKIRVCLQENGIPMVVDSPTNQLFPILPNEKVESLSKDFNFEVWGRPDETHTAIRLVTSWATGEEAVDALIDALIA